MARLQSPSAGGIVGRRKLGTLRPLRSSILLFLLAVLLTACGPADSPTSPTSPPSPTAQPAVDGWVLLAEEGGLDLLDAGGRRTATYPGPAPWDLSDDLRAGRGISPLGTLAFRAVSGAGDPADMSLEVVATPDLRIVAELPLIGSGLAERFDPENNLRHRDVLSALREPWFNAVWSPGGRYLAYPAARDSTSTDVYVYDSLTGNSQRLTDERDQAVVLGWSPDGAGLLYVVAQVDSPPPGSYATLNLRFLNLASGERTDLRQVPSYGRLGIVGWLDEREVVVAIVDDTAGLIYELVLVNASSGEVTSIVVDDIFWADVGADRTLAYTVSGEYAPAAAVYLWRQGDDPPRRLPRESPEAARVEWQPRLGLFAVEFSEEVLTFTAGGEVRREFPGVYCLPSPSPSGQWLAFGSCAFRAPWAGDLKVFDRAGKPAFTLPEVYPEGLAWSADGDRLFFLGESERGRLLYSLRAESWEVDDLGPTEAYSMVELRPEERAVVDLDQLSTVELVGEAAPAPDAPLAPGGPWLVGTSVDGWHAMNSDGSGELLLNPSALGRLQSETGRLAVLSTGSPPSPAQHHLSLWQLPMEAPMRTIPLFSEELSLHLSSSEVEKWLEDVFLAVNSGFFAWSPEGDQLAFTAAIQGPSSDLYVYDQTAEEVFRLTRGNNQALDPGPLDPWSPDGRWILHKEGRNLALGEGGTRSETLAYWAAAADGSELIRLSLPQNLTPVAWLDSETLLLSGLSQFAPPEGIAALRLGAARSVNVHQGLWSDLAVDSGSGTVLFSISKALALQFGEECMEPVDDRRSQGEFCGEIEGDSEPGLYLWRSGSDEPIRIAGRSDGSFDDVRWLSSLGQFAVGVEGDFGDQAWLVDRSGQVVQNYPERCLPVVSPDGRYLAFSCRGQFGLRLYDTVGNFVAELSDEEVDELVWSPDSSALYYLVDGVPPSSLRVVGVADGEITIVDDAAGWHRLFIATPPKAGPG